MNRRALVAVLAVVLAILGIASLVVWTNGARDRAFSGTQTVPVYQVTKNVPAGAEAESIEGSVEQVNLPKASVPATAVTSLAALRGKVTTANLVPGEVLVTGRFDSDKDAIEVPVPKGLQELTIEVASTRVLGGVLRRGDRVGVLATYGTYPDTDHTNFAANRALVLAVTSLAGPASGDAQVNNTGGVVTGNIQVRLALPSLSVEKVVHASEVGKVWLARQNKDAEVSRRDITSADVLK